MIKKKTSIQNEYLILQRHIFSLVARLNDHFEQYKLNIIHKPVMW